MRRLVLRLGAGSKPVCQLEKTLFNQLLAYRVSHVGWIPLGNQPTLTPDWVAHVNSGFTGPKGQKETRRREPPGEREERRRVQLWGPNGPRHGMDFIELHPLTFPI